MLETQGLPRLPLLDGGACEPGHGLPAVASAVEEPQDGHIASLRTKLVEAPYTRGQARDIDDFVRDFYGEAAEVIVGALADAARAAQEGIGACRGEHEAEENERKE